MKMPIWRGASQRVTRVNFRAAQVTTITRKQAIAAAMMTGARASCIGLCKKGRSRVSLDGASRP
jgi:hypothetical protein